MRPEFYMNSESNWEYKLYVTVKMVKHNEAETFGNSCIPYNYFRGLYLWHFF